MKQKPYQWLEQREGDTFPLRSRIMDYFLVYWLTFDICFAKIVLSVVESGPLVLRARPLLRHQLDLADLAGLHLRLPSFLAPIIA